MHKQESDITSYIEPRRKEAFFCASLWPVGWGDMAQRHKLAADHIYEIAYKASQRVHKRFLRRIFVGRILRFFLKREVASSSRNLKGRELSDRLDESLITHYLLLSGYSLVVYI